MLHLHILKKLTYLRCVSATTFHDSEKCHLSLITPFKRRGAKRIMRYSVLCLAMLIAVIGRVNAATVINFDNLPTGTIVTNQYPEVSFSSNAGSIIVTRNDFSLGSSPPNYICTGSPIFNCMRDVILDFTNPVSDLRFLALGSNASGVVARVDVFVDGTLSSTVNVFGNPAFFTPIPVDLTAFNNVTRIRIHSVTDPGGLAFDDFSFNAAGCTVNVQRLSQGGSAPWADDLYDHSSTSTISEKGCALTALSMALNFVGIVNDPGSLNEFMIENDSDYVGSSVNWGPATRDRSGGTIKFHAFRSSSTADLEKNLCKGFPVIVGVNLNSKGVPQHFVLVTGKQGDKFLINDPGFASRISLDDYDNKFETRGYVADPPGDISELDLAVGDTAELLVIDAIGRRTGLDKTTGMIVEEIPNSVYFRDALEDDVTGEPPTETGHLSQIYQPLEGTYSVTLIGLKLGTYALSVRAFSQDGSAQPPIVIQGVTEAGSTSSFLIQFASTNGAASSVVRVATFENTLNDIRNSLELGLIDNQGIARALSSKIEAAVTAARRGNLQASKNILEAFKAQIKAQTNKHISKLAAQVLLEDVDSLLRQLRQ